MKKVGRIRGSAEQALPLIVGKDTVYVHTNIEKVEETDANGERVENLFEYDETQYPKDEYIKLLSEQNAAMEDSLTETQLALCEVYELIA